MADTTVTLDPGQTGGTSPITGNPPAGAPGSRIAGPPAPIRQVTGYWLAVLPGQGFGIVHGTGPSTGTAHARYLGTTKTQIAATLHTAVAQLHAEQVYEVRDGVGKMIDTAVSKGSAWAAGPASVSWDLVPTAILVTVISAGLGGIALGAGAGAGEAAAGGAAAGGAAVAGGAAAGEAGLGAAGAGAAGAAGAAAGGAAKTVVKGAAKVVKGAAKNPGKAAALVGGAALAGLFTDVSWWKGLGMILAGAILIIIAIRELT